MANPVRVLIGRLGYPAVLSIVVVAGAAMAVASVYGERMGRFLSFLVMVVGGVVLHIAGLFVIYRLYDRFRGRK